MLLVMRKRALQEKRHRVKLCTKMLRLYLLFPSEIKTHSVPNILQRLFVGQYFFFLQNWKKF